MLCLRGLFNSANRQKKACVSHAVEAAIHPWHSPWRGSAPSADLCELTVAVSPGLCPTREWTPILCMHMAHRSCQFMLMHFWISHEKQLIFWAGWWGVFTRSLITILCQNTCWLCGLRSETRTESKECPFKIRKQSLDCLIYCTRLICCDVKINPSDLFELVRIISVILSR